VSYRVHRVRAEDWARIRTLRLAALADTPIAFVERYEDAAAAPDTEWQFRAARAARDPNMQVLAVNADGEWVGMMSAFVPEDRARRAKLVGVWVHPDHRGRVAGVAQLLLDAVLDWARDEVGVDRIDLQVTQTNTRAIAFYLRNGFVRNGRDEPYPLDRSLIELGMSRTV
jgi:RimJ/RimL family protein N-acetyltransferase